MFKVFDDIVFEERFHSYYFKSNPQRPTISVTTILNKYKKPFDIEYWSNKKAEELGVLPEDIRKSWRDKALFSTSKGTLVHYYLEMFYNNGKFEIPENINNTKEVIGAFNNTKSICKKFIIDHHKKLKPIKSELVLGDYDLGIVGTADQLFYDYETGLYHIYDWKTNQEIKQRSNYKLINSLSHLDDTEINTYSLQLGIYKYILEKNTNLKFGESKIVHLKENNDNYIIYNTKNLDKEIELIIKEQGRN